MVVKPNGGARLEITPFKQAGAARVLWVFACLHAVIGQEMGKR